MPKLTADDKFLDLSDYGRPIATFFVNQIKNTRITAVHITCLFGISGLIAIYFVLHNYYFLAGIFLIIKSILDAADGELARVKQQPSYVGRYLDSVFDIILNFLLFLAIAFVAKVDYLEAFLAFFCLQLQGTLYNYYYVILRNNSIGGDATSQIFENRIPKAFPGERQWAVNVLFVFYIFSYGIFDRIIYFSDKNASKSSNFPNWFMTIVSIYGLGFQLLLIAIMLAFNWIVYVIPFFIGYSIFIFGLIFLRKFQKKY